MKRTISIISVVIDVYTVLDIVLVMGGKKRGVVEENNKKAASKKEVFEDGSQV